jgi:hypothetical protein
MKSNLSRDRGAKNSPKGAWAQSQQSTSGPLFGSTLAEQGMHTRNDSIVQNAKPPSTFATKCVAQSFIAFRTSGPSGTGSLLLLCSD